MPKGIYITLQDIQIIRGCSQTQASNIKNTYLSILERKRKDLTINEFCELEEITPEIFSQAINNYYQNLTAKS